MDSRMPREADNRHNVFMIFLLRLMISALGLWIVDSLWNSIWMVPDTHSTAQRILIYFLVGLVLTAVNSVIKPIIQALTGCLYVLTLGLFALIINGLMLLLTSWITTKIGYGLHVENFWSGVGAALLLSILTSIFSIPLRSRAR